ncbi:MAG: DUF421 domain-containing protein [Candidatus Microbacterium stercoravium]
MPEGLSAVIAHLGATPLQLVGVVAAACGIYLAFLVLVRIFGPRSLHGMSTFDAILVIMFGAVAGRVILGYTPTLAAGVVGLATLFLLEAIFGQLRATVRGMRVLNARPVLVFIEGAPIPAAMKRTHVTEAELNSALRRSGVRSGTEVACVVFEPNGHLSIIRYGEQIDLALFEDVIGSDRLRDVDFTSRNGNTPRQ